MIFRFSLYGFLKNQRYFEPFLILAFLQKGLSYSTIGFLIGFRELCINIMEIPTGAIADVAGRRKSMIFSFCAYIGSFFIFGISNVLWMLFTAMFLFSIGEAFRTGTHKAIIFDWLKRQNHENEKTTVYGYTRSWSKMGSAVSVIIAAALMFFSDNYSRIFLLSMIPGLLNIINFITYPQYLDGSLNNHKSISNIVKTLFSALSSCFRIPRLRRLLIESTNYEGLFKASKDYLQPILQITALGLPVFLSLQGRQRTAILVGLVYFILHLLSSIASRHAGRFAQSMGSEEIAGRRLWFLNMIIFIMLAAGIVFKLSIIAISAFIFLAIVQNFWRPILISRFANLADPDKTATILSVESQSKSLFVVIVAPPLGWAIDHIGKFHPQWEFLPLAIIGIFVTLIMILTGRKETP
jgi:MFS family permease